jgi:hypothetical protein
MAACRFVHFAPIFGLALLVAPTSGVAQTAAPASPPAAAASPSRPAAAPTATPPATAAAWHKQEGPGGVFTVEMPAKPGYKLEQAKSGGGTAFGYHSYSLDHDGRAFVMQTATYPADVEVKNPKANLEKALEASGKHLQSKKWDKVTWTKWQGTTDVEATGMMNDKLEFRNFLVLKGHQMYSAGYAGPVGTIRSADAERFFKSLRIGR